MRSRTGNQQQASSEEVKEYGEQMVEDHEKALKLAQDAAKNAKDPELKAMAQKAAPDIQQHLQMAKQLSDKGLGRRLGHPQQAAQVAGSSCMPRVILARQGYPPAAGVRLPWFSSPCAGTAIANPSLAIPKGDSRGIPA